MRTLFIILITILSCSALVSAPIITVQSGHNNPAYYLAISDNQHYAITSSNEDKIILLWDVDRWKQIRTIASDSSSWGVMTFSKDSRSVVYAASNFDIVRCDTVTGRELSRSKKHLKKVNSVDISSDENRILSASDDSTIILWDARSGRLIKQINSIKVNVKDEITWPKSVCFSPDGKQFVSCGVNSRMTLWDAVKGTRIFEMSDTPYEKVKFSPDGKSILSFIHSFGGPVLDIWSASTGKKINKTPDLCTQAYGRELALVKNFGHSSNSSLIYLVDSDSLYIWNAADQLLKEKHPLSLKINSAALMQDNNRLFGASKSGLFVYDIAQKKITASFGKKTETLSCAHIAGKRLITSNCDGFLLAWNMENLAPEQTYKIFDNPVKSMLPFPDGKTALVIAENNVLKIINLSTLKEEKTFTVSGRTLKFFRKVVAFLTRLI